MKHIKRFDESSSNIINLIGKRNPAMIIKIVIKDFRYEEIDKGRNRFPFFVGQRFNLRELENWACMNNFTIDGKDTCPEKKVMGIRQKDIPMGHELRMLYPSKFKK